MKTSTGNVCPYHDRDERIPVCCLETFLQQWLSRVPRVRADLARSDVSCLPAHKRRNTQTGLTGRLLCEIEVCLFVSKMRNDFVLRLSEANFACQATQL